MIVVTMQNGMAQFVGQGKAAQGCGERATEPDQVFAWFQETEGTLWVVFRVKRLGVQAKPGYEII